MQKNLKSNKGITLITLVITIVVMLILSFTISINANNYIERTKKSNLDTDLQRLQEKIEIYYSKNKEIPVLNKYTNVAMLEKKENDNENYFVIDLDKLEGIELNYGKDFEKAKQLEGEIADLLDIYIINEESHVIYYPKGVKFDNKMYYTLVGDQSKISNEFQISEIELSGENSIEVGETTKLNFKLIPSFVESNGVNWNSENEEIATVDENGIVTGVSYGITNITATLKENEEIKKSFEIKVIYPTVQISIIAEKNSTINGEVPSYSNPIIPKGFRAVDRTSGDDTILETAKWETKEGYKSGLVIEDEKANQYVWVPVDKEVVILSRYTFGADGTENKVSADTKDNKYVEQNMVGAVYSLQYGNKVAKDINKFIQSVEKNGGYYIARYEASYGENGKVKSIKTTKLASLVTGNSPSEEGVIWNNIKQTEAATLCQNTYSEEYGVESDLINSLAWDTALTFIQKYSETTNYSVGKLGNIGTKTAKLTGETEDTACNIYDLSGNYSEWTTETSIETGKPCTARGGNYENEENVASSYITKGAEEVSELIAFRTILYVK